MGELHFGKMEAEQPMEVTEETTEVTMESLEVTSQPVDAVKSTETMQPMLVDPNLPEGWKRIVTQRLLGVSAGSWDVYIHGFGKRFRSKLELERYITENNISDIKVDDIDFTVWGKGVKAPRTPRTPKFGKQTPVKTPKSNKKTEEKEMKKCNRKIFLSKKEKKEKKKITQG